MLPAGDISQLLNSSQNIFICQRLGEPFLTPQFSIETICCVTPHKVQGQGQLPVQSSLKMP